MPEAPDQGLLVVFNLSAQARTITLPGSAILAYSCLLSTGEMPAIRATLRCNARYGGGADGCCA